MGEGPKDTGMAVSAASRVATARARAGGVRSGGGRKRFGSLVLTALAVIFVLAGMLWLMLKLAP